MKTIKSIVILVSLLTTPIIMAQESTAADLLRKEASTPKMNMYVIERDIPNVGASTTEDLTNISKKSCSVLDGMGSNIKWVNSFVTGDKIYCVYLAENIELVKEHATKGGFPANKISKVENVIDPSTANN
ncbi:DUF4242 domain-containing protein [Gaetbulibacter sp. M240]|uniref:DUF4242 domain-containing protein n=1 Tax=Gaetbulibacter sp. M240 TaxID=3126511 RepID=UPI00374E95BA